MIIDRLDVDGTPFKKLVVGTVFLWKDTTYLKIRIIFDHQGNVKHNAIRLSDGCPERFQDDAMVCPRHNAHLVLE